MMNLKSSVLTLFVCAGLVFTACRKESQPEISPAAQETQTLESRDEVCGAMMFPDAAARSRMQEMESRVQAHIAAMHNTAMRSTGVINIPVVFHVVWNLSEQNISDAQLLSQVDVLNEDFSQTNADRTTAPTYFQGLAGNPNLHFVMAARDPQGNATNGIIRTYSTVTSFSSDGSVCYNSLGGQDAWPSTSYLNIWVCKKSGAAGYSSYPWSGSAATDGIIVGYNFVGRTGTFTNNWNFQKGRTVTHEVGHWLGLIHIWGDAACGDDLVGDTPTQSVASGSCPTYPHMSACSPNSNGDMFMNYMDYTYDACRVMFSQQQVARMNGYLDVAPRLSLATSLGGTPPNQTTCNVPAGLVASSLTTSSAVLAWAATGAVSYNVRYKPTTSSTWATVSSTGLSVTAGSLLSSTTYEFQVQSVCASGSSAYSSSTTFTTLTVVQACNIPSGLNAASITSQSATLNWGLTGAVSYNVRYKATASSVWTTVNTVLNSKSISALAANTYYEFQVQSVCATGSSAYSSSVTFKTAKRTGHQMSTMTPTY
jgi:hypothetical protein